MKTTILVFVVLYDIFFRVCSCELPWWHLNRHRKNAVPNTTINFTNVTQSFNETTLANFTYAVYTHADNTTHEFANFSSRYSQTSTIVDCLGLGKTVATTLEWFFRSNPNGTRALDVRFYLSSRKQPRRVHVVLGEQFGLEWTDFKIERRTVIIVHGFLSYGEIEWIRQMESALLKWDNVNVVVIDWSAGSHTMNYYKAAVNTRIVGYQISRFIEHITNTTVSNNGPDTSNWGPLHLIGHSLGAHICGFAAKELKKGRNKWTVQRITGLDPAQPCFRNADPSVHLHKTDAPFVDVIHTNGRLFMKMGLGLPEALGHIDFYPNGGKTQPGCKRNELSFFRSVPIPTAMIEQAICSHGRSYEYFTESLVSAAMNNCSFWAHQWNLTYRNLMEKILDPCDKYTCTEMGIKAEIYNQRGTFFVATASTTPFCVNSSAIIEEVKRQLEWDYRNELKD